MKRLATFVLTVFRCACFTCPFFFWFWGSFNLFGTQGFHMNYAIEGLIDWGIPAAVLLAICVTIIKYIVRVIRKR